MNLDGLTMSVLAKELNERLQTGQIQKLYQIDKTTLLFKIRALNEDQNLIITVGATPAMYLSKPLQDLPKEPSSLCMFLRKHIEGSRIVKVEQINGDRIMCIQTDKLEMDGSITSTYIYIELMGKYSNCIFVQDGIILESFIHVSPLMNRERIISPKLQYDLPPNANRVSLMDFDNNEIKITKEEAIKIALIEDENVESNKIASVDATLKVVKMNTKAYERSLNKEEFYKPMQTVDYPDEARKYYLIDERIRNAWVVTIKYEDNYKDVVKRYTEGIWNYFVDATTGEIIGGATMYYSN